MGYADISAVRTTANLGPQGESAAVDARLIAIDEALSLLFEEKTGRRWAVDAPVAETRPVTLRAGAAHSGVVPLPHPGIRSLVGVTVGATWNGAAWTGGEVVPADAVLPVWESDGAYLGLRLGLVWPWGAGAWYGGSWTGTALVEAVWADAPLWPVPADVREALTFLVAEEYKQEIASPESTVGPDGLAVRTRNPWRFERVAGAVARHKRREAITV